MPPFLLCVYFVSSKSCDLGTTFTFFPFSSSREDGCVQAADHLLAFSDAGFDLDIVIVLDAYGHLGHFNGIVFCRMNTTSLKSRLPSSATRAPPSGLAAGPFFSFFVFLQGVRRVARGYRVDGDGQHLFFGTRLDVHISAHTGPEGEPAREFRIHEVCIGSRQDADMHHIVGHLLRGEVDAVAVAAPLLELAICVTRPLNLRLV